MVSPVALSALISTCFVLAAAGASAAPPDQPRVSMPHLGVAFERNTGRWPRQVEFVARTGQGTLFLTKREMVLSLRGKGKAAALRLKLQGANPRVATVGVKKLPGIVNYFMGNDPKKWRTSIPTYSGVRMAGVHPGIDLVTYGAGTGNALEYDFVVEPGADPSRIRLALSGAKSLKARGGALVASTACGDVTLNRPYAYQTVYGVRKQVACSYKLERNSVAFQVARYDTSRPLVVDPVLEYGRLLEAGCSDVAGDAVGSAYLTGDTGAGFPVTIGAFDTTHNGGTDAFVAKLAPDGSGYVYCTYVGGSGEDSPSDIVVDRFGSATVCGSTRSADFPTVAAFDATHSGGRDAFVARLSADGSTLVGSTYLGGSADEATSGLALDDAGSVYVAGPTASADFPTTPGAFAVTPFGGGDAFVAKLSADIRSLVYGTYLGGAANDEPGDLTVDAGGCAHVVGTTQSADYPTTPGAFDRSYNLYDVFVTKLNPDGTGLAFSTFLGGSSGDYGYAIALDSDNRATVTGRTFSPNFPTTAGAYDTHYEDWFDYQSDIFVTRLTADGGALVYSTFMGGARDDDGYCIALDADGAAFIAGMTEQAGFLGDAQRWNYAFIAKLRADGRALTWGGILGTLGSATAVTVDASGNIYATGADMGDMVDPRLRIWLYKWNRLHIVALNVYGYPSASTYGVGDGVEWRAEAWANGSPVPGRAVHMALDGVALQPDPVTDSTGCARFPYRIARGSVGSHTLVGTLDGDADYAPAGGSRSFKVVRGNTATDMADAAGFAREPLDLVAVVTNTANDGRKVGIAGAPTTFAVDGVPIGSAIADADGTVRLSYTPPTWGSQTITAAFGGDVDFEPSTGLGTLAVDARGIRTAITAADAATSPGRSAALRATLRQADDGAPLVGKMVTFLIDGTPLGWHATNAAGLAWATMPVQAGPQTREIRAVFAGDNEYEPADGVATLTVRQGVQTAIYVPDRVGAITDTVRLKAYLYEWETKTFIGGKSLRFTVDGVAIGSATTSAGGEAVLDWIVADGPAGRRLDLAFAGDNAYLASWGSAHLAADTYDTEVVAPDATAVLCGKAVVRGYLYRLPSRAPVAGKVLEFEVNGVAMGSATTNYQGRALLTPVIPEAVGAGDRTLRVQWAGDGGFRPSSGTAALAVSKAPTMLWLGPRTIHAGLGQQLELQAYLRRTPDMAPLAGKMIALRYGGTILCEAPTSSRGWVWVGSSWFAGYGAYTMTATFDGDNAYQPSSGSAIVTMAP